MKKDLINPEIIMTALPSILAGNLTAKQRFTSRTNNKFTHPSLEGPFILHQISTGYQLTRLSDGAKFECEVFEDHFYPTGITASCEYSKVKYIGE